MADWTLNDLLGTVLEAGASDLHLKAGRPGTLRIKGQMTPISMEPLSAAELRTVVEAVLTPQQKEQLVRDRELDFSYQIEDVARFRGNLFWQKGVMGAVFRHIPAVIPTLESLGMPPFLKTLAEHEQGLVLVTGPTGSGKSTTLAAIIDHLNETQARHVVTIEDPLEFVHQDKNCLVNQREVGSDTRSFQEALRRSLRQDPDVILVGEMRDAETIKIAMTAAETGHLVFSTLHTNDAKQSIDRIINAFPPGEQHQVQMQLSLVLLAVVSQRLVRRKDGTGCVAAQEFMVNSPTVRKMLEDGKTAQLDKVIEESREVFNMQSMNQSLFDLWTADVIGEAEALAISNNAADLRVKMQTSNFAATQHGDATDYARKQGLTAATDTKARAGLESRYGS